MAITQQDEQQLTRIAKQNWGKGIQPPKQVAPAESFPEHSVQAEEAAQKVQLFNVEQRLYEQQVPAEVATLVDTSQPDATVQARVSELALAYKRISANYQPADGSADAKARNAADQRRANIPNPWA